MPTLTDIAPSDGLHRGGPVLLAGTPLAEASAALILVHGRGASARSIMTLADELDLPDGFACAAPQAANATWYPTSFLAPLSQNEPWLSSALATVGDVVTHMTDAGVPPERIVLLGFSQGACLSLEYAARHPQRYGGVVALSGGLIGSGTIPGEQPPDDKTFTYDGSLEQTPVFLGCSDVDAHIPVGRVHTSAEVFTDLDAAVTKRIYPGMGHTVNTDEVAFVRSLVRDVAA